MGNSTVTTTSAEIKDNSKITSTNPLIFVVAVIAGIGVITFIIKKRNIVK